MELRSIDDPAAFLERAGDLLMADEARHNLLLGIAAAVAELPGEYPGARFWVLEDGGRPMVAALQTPPFNLVVSRPADPAALAPLAEAIAGSGVRPPGVTAALPEAEGFVAAWERATGDVARLRVSMRAFRLTAVRPPDGVRGAMRVAGEKDRAVLRAWNVAFLEEALPEPHLDDVDGQIDRRLASRDGGFALWEADGEPVSMSGYGGRTPNGIRVGPVYTPPALRGRGYASALVAALSARCLADGRRFCFLFTDLANPTSNAIYQRIGYEPVCDTSEYAFEPPPRRSG